MYAPDEVLRAKVIDVFGRLRTQEVVRFLIAPLFDESSSPALRNSAENAMTRIVGEMPSQRNAERYLYRLVERTRAGQLAGEVTDEGLVKLWRWNDGQKTSVPMIVPMEAARLMDAANLAYDLARIAPENREYTRLALMTRLEADKVVLGLDRPLQQGQGSAREMGEKLGVDLVETVLEDAIKENNVPAAIGAAEILGAIGDESLLKSDDGMPRTFAAAMRHS